MKTFSEFDLDPLIIQSLDKMLFKEPSLIQLQAIPLILQGRDLIALAQTGSGKTAACAIPICQRVNTANPVIQALIIVPTRELAVQYATETRKIGHAKDVKTFAICGGEDANLQLSKLRAGVHVLVATPGRLIDFIYSKSIDLSHVETLILDEADEMLSMGFYDDLEFIINCLVHTHQTLLFSATMPADIRKIAHRHMNDPLEIALSKEHASPKSLEHRFVYCHPMEREKSLIDQMHEMKPPQSLVFCQSRLECEAIARALKKHFDKVDFLHAGLTQDVRTIITSKFRSGKISCLVATDVAARGLDFSNITHVFVYQLSSDPEAYVHRAGRTGRNDKQGVAVAFVTNRDLPTVSKILTMIDREPIWIGSPPPIHVQQKPKQQRGRSQPRRYPRKASPNKES